LPPGHLALVPQQPAAELVAPLVVVLRQLPARQAELLVQPPALHEALAHLPPGHLALVPQQPAAGLVAQPVVEQLQLLARLLLELVAQLVAVLRHPVRLVELLVQQPVPQEPVVVLE
jgi:hypothetical protein